MHEYDGAQLVRSITTRESRWTEQDRAEVLAYQQWKASFCPCGCGLKAADTLSDETTGPAFVADRVVCRARMTLIDAQDAIAQAKSPYGPARQWRVRKR